MRVIRLTLPDGSIILVRAVYENCQTPTDSTDALDKVKAALDQSPLTKETRFIYDR